MASRKEEKEQARAQREALEREHAAGAQRRRRVRQLAAVVAVAAVAVVLAVVLSPGAKKKGITTGASAGALVSSVSAELRGLPQAGTRLGRPSAPVRMDYYGDLQCPICRDFTETGLAETIAAEVRSGRLQIRYRSLQTATPDPATFAVQQTAALAAGRQNRLWQFVELFYRQQGAEGTGYVTPAYLARIAAQTPGLDRARWQRDRTASALQDVVRADTTAAQIAGADATPALVLTGPKGTRKLTGNVAHADLVKAIGALTG